MSCCFFVPFMDWSTSFYRHIPNITCVLIVWTMKVAFVTGVTRICTASCVSVKNFHWRRKHDQVESMQRNWRFIQQSCVLLSTRCDGVPFGAIDGLFQHESRFWFKKCLSLEALKKCIKRASIHNCFEKQKEGNGTNWNNFSVAFIFVNFFVFTS